MANSSVIDILYQCDSFVLVNKPIGLGMHQEGETPGLVTVLSRQLGDTPLFLVHRLDKVTSGLLLLAKDADSAAQLSGLFARREVEKYYLALIDRKPGKKQGAIIGDMQKARRGQWKLTGSRQNPAVSQFFSRSTGDRKRLVLLKPATGKTHQLRVALKSLGSPIIGDTLYGGSTADRTYLHAFALRFRHRQQDFAFLCRPSQGQLYETTGCQHALQSFTAPWDQAWPELKSGRQADE